MMTNDKHAVARRTMSALALGIVLTACQGGRSDGFTATERSEDGAVPNVSEGSGIFGSVAGSPHDYTGDIRYTTGNDGARDLMVVSRVSDQTHWQIAGVRPEIGIYACDETLQLRLQREGQAVLSTAGAGDCLLEVSKVNLDHLNGRFTGHLVDGSGSAFVIEDGVFQIALASAIPDLDEDGLSDADDNCPFAANPDQADNNGNGRGNACDPSDEEQ